LYISFFALNLYSTNSDMVVKSLQFREELVQLQKNMMSFALTLTTNYDEAEDLTQETLLKALDNQDKFVENTNFKGWVLTIMRNLFINNYRQTARNYTLFDSSANLYNLKADFGSPENCCIFQHIEKAIEGLSNELKQPFSMYITGYKYDEIAESLSLPLGTIKSRIFFARRELQKQLKELEHN